MYGTGIEPTWPTLFLAVHHWSSSFTITVKMSPLLNGRSSGSWKRHNNLTLDWVNLNLWVAYTSFEVVLGNDSLYSAYSWPDQRGGVQVVKFVKRQQVWQIWKGLITDPVSVLVALLHFIDYVVAYFAILPKITEIKLLLLEKHFYLTWHRVQSPHEL